VTKGRTHARTCEGVEQRGLAAAGGAHDGQHLPGTRVPADPVQDPHVGRPARAAGHRHAHVLPRQERPGVAAGAGVRRHGRR
jgi:hypothetical protein